MKILITGGSGLVGSHLTQMLKNKGIEVAWLSRRAGIRNGIVSYKWDYTTSYIDPKAFEGVTHVIHLAGAGVFEKRWIAPYKKEIYDSRIETTKLLAKHLPDTPLLQAFISCSAIGIYGNSFQTIPLKEDAAKGKDFLARTTIDWEAAADLIEKKNIRTVKIRVGIVLAKPSGALPTMIKPIKLNIGSPLASGEQIISWIHIEDLCNIFIKAVEDSSMSGAYNGVAPNPVSNKIFTRTAAEILDKPLLLPNVPAFALNIILGKEKACSVVQGIPASSAKIQAQGFSFKYPELKAALTDLLKP
ncbi:MAG: TIGR01777 family oxidoreductase [Cytophaga sp.]|uniref:TIGR01777 family oxidoreductase n=1 Tax=Cytophaga sp. TaxID=29535 RepID=UPI003F7F149A